MVISHVVGSHVVRRHVTTSSHKYSWMHIASSSFFRQFILQQYSRYLSSLRFAVLSFYIGDLRREDRTRALSSYTPMPCKPIVLFIPSVASFHPKWPRMRILSNSSITSSVNTPTLDNTLRAILPSIR